MGDCEAIYFVFPYEVVSSWEVKSFAFSPVYAKKISAVKELKKVN